MRGPGCRVRDRAQGQGDCYDKYARHVGVGWTYRDEQDAKEGRHQPTVTAFDEAMRRAQAEFLEMPGLQLTEAQAARLWCFDSALCSAVLAALVQSRFLVRTRNASFARSDVCRPQAPGLSQASGPLGPDAEP